MESHKTIYKFIDIKLYNDFSKSLKEKSISYYERNGITFYIELLDSVIGEINVYFKNKTDASIFLLRADAYDKINKKDEKDEKNIIYEYINNMWTKSLTLLTHNAIDIVGLDKHIEQIISIIDTIKANTNHLIKIGENKPINILLYGPPGCGKTLLWQLISKIKSLNIGIVPTDIIFNKEMVMQIDSMVVENIDLIPNFKYIFDKLNEIKFTDKILINFFTASSLQLEQLEPLDFYECIQISEPTIEMIAMKIKRMIPENNLISSNESDLNNMGKMYDLIELLEKKNIKSYRKIVNYTLRYMYKLDFLDQMIKHINELD